MCVIVTGKHEDFAERTAQATNRQNSVGPRDFITLETVQAAIQQEMRAQLGPVYSVRRSELDSPEETGCSVVEAACALACAHPDSQYAARIATTLEVATRLLSSNDSAAAQPKPNDKYRREPGKQVHVLIDKDTLGEGDPLTLSAAYPVEAEALRDWLAENPKRSLATWTKHCTKPIHVGAGRLEGSAGGQSAVGTGHRPFRTASSTCRPSGRFRPAGRSPCPGPTAVPARSRRSGRRPPPFRCRPCGGRS